MFVLSLQLAVPFQNSGQLHMTGIAGGVKGFIRIHQRYLVRAEAVDLFPRTAHVETIVLLQRGNS